MPMAAAIAAAALCVASALARASQTGAPPDRPAVAGRRLTTYFPHLEARLPYAAPREYPGGVVARLSILYEVDTPDFQQMIPQIHRQLLIALEDIPPAHIEVQRYEQLTGGTKCHPGTLRCYGPDWKGNGIFAPGIAGARPYMYDGSLDDADPRFCEATMPQVVEDVGEQISTTSDLIVTEFNPRWDGQGHFDELISNTHLCVNRRNTSLMLYPLALQNVYVTGYRDDRNARISRDNDYRLNLHIVGRIPVNWAEFLSYKFIFNGTSVPLPMFQPEVRDPTATETEFLNWTAQILGVRQRAGSGELLTDDVEGLLVCTEPPIPITGCVRMDYEYYWHPRLPEYKLQASVALRRLDLTTLASDPPYPAGEFNVSQGPWPYYEWIGERAKTVGPWQQKSFPQKESVHLEGCHRGNACEQIPLSPSPRHLHSAVLYTTWNFEEQVRRYLCNERSECGPDCLTNLTCLGGESYFNDNFYFRSNVFRYDDGGIVPYMNLSNQDCPDTCCRDRRLCLRVHDVMGYPIPFSSEMMLVFGGKTYVHEKDPGTGRLIYHTCERIPRADLREEWQSCKEIIAGDLWRYDVVKGHWEYLKPDSALSLTTGEPVGYPLARYGHGAVVVYILEGNDEGFRRYYMYMYGGLSPQCSGGGICNDVWRYEIPWAAQAYYPKFPEGEWIRGNQWGRMKDCQFGGRYRHAMVATSGQEYIYVYGGQAVGGFSNMLMRYKVSTDRWEDLDPYGRISLTRLMYDYRGMYSVQSVPTAYYNRDIDVDCPNAWSFDGKWSHCQACPTCRLHTDSRLRGGELPEDRGDTALAAFADHSVGSVDDILAMFGGYRSTWGSLRDSTSACAEITTTPPPPTTTPPPVGPIVLTDPPSTTAFFTTTAPVETSNIVVIGTFQQVGPTRTSTVTTTVLYSTTTTLVPGSDLVGLGPTRTATTTTTVTSTTLTFTSTTTTTVTPGLPTSTTTTTTPTVTTTELGAEVTTAPPVVAGIQRGQAANRSQDFESLGDEGALREGPQLCTPRYYFDDLWLYDASMNQFARHSTVDERPMARKGHKLLVRRARSNDSQLVLFGGHNQDTPVSDMWILNVLREPEARRWARIDPYFEGQKPPSMSYHSMLYSEAIDQFIVFGGIHWNETDLERSDALRNIDRRCLKRAQGIVDEHSGANEVTFLQEMITACEASDFCCVLTNGTGLAGPPVYIGTVRVRTASGALNLSAVSTMCRAECQAVAFTPEYYPIMSEGVWTFSTNVCPGNCSGMGICDMSQCVCEPSRSGIDCSQRRCPNSPCYTDSLTKEQSCIDCSGHGRCIDGECQCFPGWGLEDCSAVLCPASCSSNGHCVEDFPVHQCVCTGRFSGANCSELSCLNDCSGRGSCDAQGVCDCQTGFHGEDCSLFVMPAL